jgi:hypothetical protein
MSVIGISQECDVVELFESYGFGPEVASSANSILYGKSRSKKDIRLKYLEVLWMAHNKHSIIMDLHTISERIGLTTKIKMQPEKDKIVIHTAKEYLEFFLQNHIFSSTEEEIKDKMRDLADIVDGEDGLPVLAPDAAVAIIRKVLQDSDISMKKEFLCKSLGRPIMPVNIALLKLNKKLDKKLQERN